MNVTSGLSWFPSEACVFSFGLCLSRSLGVGVESGGWKCRAIVLFSCGIPLVWESETVACFEGRAVNSTQTLPVSFGKAPKAILLWGMADALAEFVP